MRVVIVLAVLVGIFACVILACLGSGDDEPVVTPAPQQPLNEAIAEGAGDVLEAAEEGQSTLCNLCLLGSKPEDCTGVCK